MGSDKIASSVNKSKHSSKDDATLSGTSSVNGKSGSKVFSVYRYLEQCLL